MIPPPSAGGAADAGPVLGVKQVEIAVDTDFEYFQLFNDEIAAREYIMTLYGAISDLYIREVRSTVVVTYFRLWTTPDPFTNASPLNQFQNLWNNTQQAVHRDTAQLLLARANLSAGGVAYLPGLCNNSSYSWAGYVLGHFGDLDRTDDFSRDIGIAVCPAPLMQMLVSMQASVTPTCACSICCICCTECRRTTCPISCFSTISATY